MNSRSSLKHLMLETTTHPGRRLFKVGMELTDKVKMGLVANGIEEPVKSVAIKDPGLAGEGFASQARYITVEFENPDVKSLNLFAKIVTNSESHSQMLDDIKAFEKESTFLSKYVISADEMCKKKGCEGCKELYPKCYYGDSKTVILENLVLDQGYCLLDKTERQDLRAASFALNTLAKHHAISYAMIEEEGGPANFFKRFPSLDFEPFDTPHLTQMMEPMLKNSLTSNIKILENNLLDGRDEAVEFLKQFLDVSLTGLMSKALPTKKGEVRVLNHGDYHNNNMMFLMDKSNQVIGHKTIDLQVTRYNVPTLDLSYFMFMSVKTTVRVEHLEELLKTYLETLTKVSTALGHPIPLTYEQLFQSFREKLDFGFWLSMVTVIGPGMNSMKEIDMNTIDVKDFATVMVDGIQKWFSKNPEYSSIIAKELVQLAFEYKRLSLRML